MGVFGRARNRVYSLRQRLTEKPMIPKSFNFAMLSHPGRVRKGNEDMCAASVESGAFIVCDGMGGAAAGEIASRIATDTFLQALAPTRGTPRKATPDVRLDEAIEAANKAVYQHSRQKPELRGMGTTLVALLYEPIPDKLPALTLAHVGDSRCYLFRAGSLTALTLDHSLVEEQLRLGEITPEEAEHHPMRNIITRAVGSQSTVEPEIRHLEARAGDLFLLASDGLTRELSDPVIAATFQRAIAKEEMRQQSLEPEARSESPSRSESQSHSELDLAGLCQTLVDQANDAGGGDNITVLVLAL